MSNEQTADSGQQAAGSDSTSVLSPQSSVLPLDKKTGQPMPPRAQPGYYPEFNTLSQQAFWDEATRKVVLDRVQHVPPIRFFNPDEARVMAALCDRLLPQDDRDAAHKIPIVNIIDDRLFTGRIDGYRFEDMPPDGEAFRLGLQGIEAVARHLHNRSFADLGPREQDQILWALHDENPPAGEEFWKRVPLDRFWVLLMGDVADAYYAHPFAWDEIGFGGPAYPRGYMRLENGKPEPWEVRERRYDWDAPETSLSDAYRPIGGTHPGRNQPTGQEGTH
jgi:Gluconate 2-dehydrogenase subunit 3